MREGHTAFLLENLEVTGSSADLELLRRTILAPIVEKQREKERERERERTCVWTEMNCFFDVLLTVHPNIFILILTTLMH